MYVEYLNDFDDEIGCCSHLLMVV